MHITWRSELPQLVFIAAMFLAAIAAWPFAPDRLPVHWNLQGEVDGYAGKATGLLLVPAITLGIYLLLLWLPRIDPRYANYVRFEGTYLAIRVTLVMFLTLLYGATLLAAFGQPIDVGLVISLGVGGLFVVLGSLVHRLQPNWFVGIRTPWTLSSDLAWKKTHRVGGWLFLLLGPMVAAIGVVRAGWYLAVTLVVGGVGLAGLVVYSYWVYRHDPRWAPPANTPSEDPGG